MEAIGSSTRANSPVIHSNDQQPPLQQTSPQLQTKAGKVFKVAKPGGQKMLPPPVQSLPLLPVDPLLLTSLTARPVEVVHLAAPITHQDFKTVLLPMVPHWDHHLPEAHTGPTQRNPHQLK